MGALLAEARERGVVVIVSDHCFQRTPAMTVLHRRLEAAYAAGADLAKVACRTEDAADLARVMGLFAQSKGRPLSVMGMGPMGKISRLLCARLGSALNYGYLDQPQVPGQWSAPLLKARVTELLREE
jgi:3-dehydroquinate dehydratase-1